jgi:Asp/Glu/hydantoin racemase
MSERILIINPNSTEAVTEHMSAALDAFRFPGGPQLICETLRSGPPGIETQAHVDGATANLIAWFDEEPERIRADAVVIGCFSDPGVAALRERLAMPIFGMGASSYLTAAAMANSFGVISVVSGSIARHLRAIGALGLGERLAADIAVDLSVVELSNEALTWDRMVAVGQKLRDEHGADVVILGCAGMARYRTRLEATLGLTVIDPTQAATGMAMNAVLARRGAAVADRKAA